MQGFNGHHADKYIPNISPVKADDLNAFESRISRLEALGVSEPLTLDETSNGLILGIDQSFLGTIKEWLFIELYDDLASDDATGLGKILVQRTNKTYTASNKKVAFKNLLKKEGAAGTKGFLIRFPTQLKEYILLLLDNTACNYKWVTLNDTITDPEGDPYVSVTNYEDSTDTFDAFNIEGIFGETGDVAFVVKVIKPVNETNLGGFTLGFNAGYNTVDPDQWNLVYVRQVLYRYVILDEDLNLDDESITVHDADDDTLTFTVVNYFGDWGLTGDAALIGRAGSEWRFFRVNSPVQRWVTLQGTLDGTDSNVNGIDVDDGATVSCRNYFLFTGQNLSKALVSRNSKANEWRITQITNPCA